MGTTIISIILLAIFILAIMRAKKHFKGGGCCGSGSNTIRSHKALTEPKIGEYVFTIQGMHCENCQARVENAVNRLEGVVCTVNLKKHTATISYSQNVAKEALIATIENLGYQVTAAR